MRDLRYLQGRKETGAEFWWGKHEGKRALTRCRRRRGDYLKLDHEKDGMA